METHNRLYDAVIIGAGPAGLSAAIYAARAKYRVLVLEKNKIGGQITITSEIVNYPGVEEAGGKELTEHMRVQAEGFGAEFVIAEVLDMELEKEIKVLHTTKGDYEALGVILAPGANPRKLGFQGEKEFQGRGVAYCATCDGEFFTGKDVFVIGGGFAAVEEGIFLTKYARKVTMIVREPDFTCARTVSDKLKDYDKIETIFETEIIEAGGEHALTYAVFKNNANGEQWRYDAPQGETFGIFVFAGYVPNTEWISESVERNEQGYLITDMDRKTNLSGVYAAGDVCVKNLRQVVTAVADGAIAATSLERIASELHSRLSIPDLYKAPEKSETESEKVREEKEYFTKGEGFISNEIRQQLAGVFTKFASGVTVRAWLNDSSLSGEIRGFLNELTAITDKVTWTEAAEDVSESGLNGMLLPAIELLDSAGKSSGIYFHGVPGGHEFNSFIIALYNVAGPGQELDSQTLDKIQALSGKRNIKILVSLTCTMCPESVMAAQRIAAASEHVSAEMIDLSHFPDLKERYNVMSVPCIVIDDEKVVFGRKNVEEMLELL
ncbi:MAG: FAD-dependent oxidoreductase [Lachnospiraceae bacterium]|nr:FAD-dependent oxidoreductase [Lachnospiraceae bacterium]MBO5145243.1 FAD-dependent oxidoreductase [Lachnospiraceae bacterium]